MPWLCVHPLRECRRPALERLLRLVRALCRKAARRARRRRLGGLDAQHGQPLLLLGQEPRPGARPLLLLQLQSDVVSGHEDAGCDAGQLAIGIGQVGEDAVVALPVQRPGAVPVRVDSGELRRALRVLRCPLQSEVDEGP